LESDYYIIEIGNIEKEELSPFEQKLSPDDRLDAPLFDEGYRHPFAGRDEAPMENAGIGRPEFPGGPVSQWPANYRPPADAYAFYMPYHLYYPHWWGIYLIAERVIELAQELRDATRPKITWDEAFRATRLYLFKHEYFHQKAETFSAKLEVTHRERMYLEGQLPFYVRTFGTDNCIEEALAEAYAIREVERILRNWKWRAPARNAYMKALKHFVSQSGPGYQLGVEYADQDLFGLKQATFAEEIRHEALGMQKMPPGIWDMFNNAFRGVGTIKSRVNYIVHANSWLSERLGLQVQRIDYQGLKRKLKKVCRCEIDRNGKGSHEIWRTPRGQTFPVPRHPGDLKPGTLSSIVKQACDGMSVYDFLHS